MCLCGVHEWHQSLRQVVEEAQDISESWPSVNPFIRLLKYHKESGNSEFPLSNFTTASELPNTCFWGFFICFFIFFFFSPVQNNKLSCFPETIHFHHIRNLLILDENSSINQFLIEFSPEGKRRNWARFAFWLLGVLTEHTWCSGIISLLHIKHISRADGALWRQTPCTGEEKRGQRPFPL